MTTATAGFDGMTALREMLRRAGPNAVLALAAAMFIEGQDILLISQGIVPIGKKERGDKHPGVLRASGHVALPVIAGTKVEVTIGYGGAARAYALVQHERDDYRHDAGKQAHFLSEPVEADLPKFEAHLAANIGKSIFVR